MRELRFRAWDGERMHENVVIVDGKAIKRGYFATAFREESQVGIPMQYTGVQHYKTHIEIYEGDVVKGHYIRHDQPGVEHRIVGQVLYVSSAFMVRGVGKYYGLECSLDATFDPIGNIYQNPELLKEAQEA